MPKETCIVDNCIPTSSSCVEWNGGDLTYLGICNGDSLNNIIVEIITKLSAITCEDVSSFDIDSLLDICTQKAPNEITILSILNVLKANQICLKDYIDTIKAGMDELFKSSGVTVDLKCYAEFDNLGNPLSISRAEFDQLCIDNLCSQDNRITTIEGKLILMQSEIDALNVVSTVDELSIATCLNGASLPTSVQLQNTSTEICTLETAIGFPSDISSALANTPGDLNSEFGLITGWILAPSNWSGNYNNLLLELENIRQRIKTIESTCCSVSCDDLTLGYTASYSTDGTSIIIRFTSSAGTSIPVGFTDTGSTITISDINGNEEVYLTISPDLISNNKTITVPIPSLDTTQDLKVDIEANFSSNSVSCTKCLSKLVAIQAATCDTCKICATGDIGTSAVIVYHSSTTSKTLVLIPGECVVFPTDVIIDAVIPTGNITISSTCPNFLPTPTGYKCWQFKWEYSNEGNFSDASMTHIKIGTVEYPLTDIPGTNYWDNDGIFLENSIPISVPSGLCNVLCNAGGEAVNPKMVAVEVPEYLGMPLVRYINPGFDMGYLIPYEDVCTC